MKNQSGQVMVIMSFVFIVILAAVTIIASFVGIAPNYSNGTRVGIVTKLSNSGLIFKSWEGEMLMALPVNVAGTTQPEKFQFNVSEGAVVQVGAAMVSGKRVELEYRQWFQNPCRISNPHVVVKIREVK